MINIMNIGFLHVVWAPNPKRLKMDPPFKCLPGNNDTGDPELDKIQIDNETRQAKRYDYYRDIKSVSLLTRTDARRETGQFRHFKVGNGISEFEMLTAFWAFISENYISHLAGWNITHCAFPMLIGKSMQYGVQVPGIFLPNPFKRYQDPAICDLSALYTQCSYQKARPLPDINDLGSWWGLQTDNALPPVSALQLSELLDEEMDQYGYASIEKSLDISADMLLLYDKLAI